MIRYYFILCLIVGYVDVFCQHSYELVPYIEREAFTILEGSIDNKYPIQMYLEQTWDYCGPSPNNKWNSRIVRGWYKYKKIGKKIPLIGSQDFNIDRECPLLLFVPKELLDSIDSNTCNMMNYKEIFCFPGNFYLNRSSIDTLQWSKYGQLSYLETYLKETHTSTWETKATLRFKIYNIDLLEFDLSSAVSNKFIDQINIEASKEIDGNFFFILRWGHLSNPGWFTSGSCGAGWEEWIGWLVINNELEISKFEYYQNASCPQYIETEYYFDKDYPEKGISIKKY